MFGWIFNFISGLVDIPAYVLFDRIQNLEFHFENLDSVLACAALVTRSNSFFLLLGNN
jgi:hypothetical protein